MANDTKISDTTALTSLLGTDKVPVSRVGGTIPVHATVSQLNGLTKNVEYYGAVGDGTTDDTNALNDAWNDLGYGDVLRFEPGKIYAISDTLSWREKNFIIIEGNYSRIVTRNSSNFTNKTMIDLAGSAYSVMKFLRVESNLTSNKPAACVVLGRTLTLSGGGNLFERCLLYGNYTAATVYNICSETAVFLDTSIYNAETAPCIYDSPVDSANLVDVEGTSNCRKFYYRCAIHNTNASGGTCVKFNGSTLENSFRECYFYIGVPGTVIHMVGPSVNYNTVLDLCRVESTATTGHANSRLIKVDNDWVDNLELKHIIWPFTDSDAQIEIMTGGAGSLITNSNLDFRGPAYKPGVLVSSGGLLKHSTIYYDKSGMVSVATGGTAHSNVLIGSNVDGTSDNPFTGSGSYGSSTHNNNIIIGGNAWVTIPYQQTQMGSITGNSATPSIAGYQHFRVVNGSATSITNFLNPVAGQEITLFFENNNTTIVHNTAYIALKGSVNWNPAAYASLTLYYHSVASKWIEKSRQDPT